MKARQIVVIKTNHIIILFEWAAVVLTPLLTSWQVYWRHCDVREIVSSLCCCEWGVMSWTTTLNSLLATSLPGNHLLCVECVPAVLCLYLNVIDYIDRRIHKIKYFCLRVPSKSTFFLRPASSSWFPFFYAVDGTQTYITFPSVFFVVVFFSLVREYLTRYENKVDKLKWFWRGDEYILPVFYSIRTKLLLSFWALLISSWGFLMED